MTFVVTDACIKCKFMDCVEVCPVDCIPVNPAHIETREQLQLKYAGLMKLKKVPIA